MRYRTACNGTVVVPADVEHHLAAHPEVLGLFPEAMRRLTLPTQKTFLDVEVDMERIVGKSGCIATDRIGFHSTAPFAQRRNRKRPSRVVLAEGPEVTTVAVKARPTRDPRTYILVTAYVGMLAPPEPWDSGLRLYDRLEAFDFWCTHALTYDPSVMDRAFQSSWAAIFQM